MTDATPSNPETKIRAESTRPWNRLHTSTYVVLLLTTVVLFLLNVPGQYEPYVGAPLEEERLFGDQRIVRERLEHGWPFCYLIRDDRYFVKRPDESEPRPTAIWSFTEDFVSFDPWRLTGDVLAALCAVGIVGLLAEYWRRQRHAIWQMRVSDLLGITAIVAGAIWYVQRTQRDYEREQSAIQHLRLSVRDYSQFRGDPVSSPVSVRSHGGPTWLRSLMGERFPKMFDRLILLDDVTFAWSLRDEAERISAFKDLRALNVMIAASPAPQLARVAILKGLEAIRLTGVFDVSRNDLLDQELAAVLPPLAELPNLWFVDGAGGGFGDRTLKVLAALPQLRVLKLSWSSMTDDGLAALAQCQTLEELSLANIRISDASLARLQRLPRLRNLSLYLCPISDAGFEQLAQFPSLERLSINDTTAYSQELHHLAGLKRLKLLELSPHVDRNAVKQLQRLVPALKIEVGGQPFHADEW
jgi:hypothetical protein